MVRRAAPMGVPVALAALLIGAFAAGWDAGVSAALGVAIAFGNFVVNGLSLARSARVSLVALQVVALGGFLVRMGIIVAITFLLNQFSFFSPKAFMLGLLPALVLLLAVEVKMVAGSLGRNLDIPEEHSTS